MSTISFPQNIDLGGVKAVLLDLDNTLYAYKPCHERALVACFELCQKHFDFDYPRFLKAYNQGRREIHRELDGLACSHSRLLYAQRMIENLSQKTHYQLSLELEEAYWSSFLDAMVLDQDAYAFIQELKKQNIKTCIVTDLTAQIQHRKIIKLGLEKNIDFLVSSEEAGVEKPEPGIFELALHKLKLTRQDVIMIGDSASKDIAGAEALGIKAYLVEVK